MCSEVSVSAPMLHPQLPLLISEIEYTIFSEKVNHKIDYIFQTLMTQEYNRFVM